MQNIVVYGKEDSTLKNFAKAKSVDYSAGTSSDITIPAWITETQSIILVSNQYLYARNTEDKASTTDKYHGAYYIFGKELGVYFENVPLTST